VKAGDVVEVSQIGVLRNPVAATTHITNYLITLSACCCRCKGKGSQITGCISTFSSLI
jgi:hypothetical protein